MRLAKRRSTSGRITSSFCATAYQVGTSFGDPSPCLDGHANSVRSPGHQYTYCPVWSDPACQRATRSGVGVLVFSPVPRLLWLRLRRAVQEEGVVRRSE